LIAPGHTKPQTGLSAVRPAPTLLDALSSRDVDDSLVRSQEAIVSALPARPAGLDAVSLGGVDALLQAEAGAEVVIAMSGLGSGDHAARELQHTPSPIPEMSPNPVAERTMGGVAGIPEVVASTASTVS
jgi:hypothetical protein